jgi:hypothetical protein
MRWPGRVSLIGGKNAFKNRAVENSRVGGGEELEDLGVNERIQT